MNNMASTPYTIGIAGGTGSGKTTIAAGLAAALAPGRVTLIDADSYYRDLSHLPLPERHHINFDHPDSLDLALLAEHLRVLKSGNPVTKHVYDFTTHSRSSETVVIEPAPVIIVEGVLIFVPVELRGLLDLKVFLDEDADVRLLRRIRRDMAERGRTFESVMRQYLAQVRPMHAQFVEPSKKHADTIYGPGATTDHVIAQIFTIIQSGCSAPAAGRVPA
jgi:uridine kinase